MPIASATTLSTSTAKKHGKPASANRPEKHSTLVFAEESATGWKPFDANWKGGFFCPCHGSKFDLSGRVFAGVPAPSNLEIPPHNYESDDVIVIGIDSEIS